MTQVGADAAPLSEAKSHGARGNNASEFSEVSFTSTLTDEQDTDFPAPMFSEASTSDLLPSKPVNGDNETSSGYTMSQPYPDADSPSRSIKPISSSSSNSHKGKQPSNGYMVDSEHHKSGSLLSTIDETAAAAASSYAYTDPYRSSANGYVQHDSTYSYREHRRIDSTDLDEAPYSPSTYPPTSEEDSEAKRVKQNLERWAAEERQRRKAQRSSKILSNRNSTVSSGSGLTQRLSILRSAGFSKNNNTNNLGAGPSSERLADGPGASPSIPYNSSMGDRSRESAARRGSASSSAGGARGLHRSPSSSSFDSTQSLGSMVSDDHRPNRKLPPIGSRVTSGNHTRDTSGGSSKSLSGARSRHLNGSARDPFRDPSDGGGGDDSTDPSRRRASLKPTPTASRPIVTVGRASSIQRRALESSYNSKGKGKGRSMPTIVATDTEAEADETSSRGAQNPFASVEDRSKATSTTIHQGGLDEEVAMELAGRGSRGLEEHGDLGESTLDSDTIIRSQPARTSTSSSKFRELGITEGDDWIEIMGRNTGKAQGRKMRIAQHASEPEEIRKPWWTELLCGCQRDYDDDEQVSPFFNTPSHSTPRRALIC